MTPVLVDSNVLIEDAEAALPTDVFRRESLPYEAAFLAGEAFLEYRKRGGSRKAPLPDFFIGAHAADVCLQPGAPRTDTILETVSFEVPR